MGGYLPHINRCLFGVHALIVGTQRTTNCTQRMLLSHWRAASVLGPGVSGACDVSVTSPEPCARLPQLHLLVPSVWQIFLSMFSLPQRPYGAYCKWD
jgi:hypothetical protein